MKSVRIGLCISAAILSGGLAFAEEQCDDETGCNNAIWDAEVRIRYANVDDSINEKANALTTRILMTMQTPSVRNFRAVFSAEHVNDMGMDSYNDGGSNGQIQYATEADPSGTEMDQAFIEFKNDKLQMRYGRQYIDHGDLPQRHLSTASWRQNYQTFDAFTIEAPIGENFKLEGALVEKAYRVIGRDHPVRTAREFDLDGIGVRATYSSDVHGDFSAYAYNLDFVDRTEYSSRTFGLRGDGPCFSNPSMALWKGDCVAEVAMQQDIGPDASNQDYLYGHLLFGLDFETFNKANETGSVAIGITLLTGDRFGSFKTPLAAVHGFAGWADKFLINTPTTGLWDEQIRLDERVFGWDFTAVLHRFETYQSPSRSYGTELDLVATRTFGKYTWVLKMAQFNADESWQPAPVGFDSTKFWTSVQFDL